MLKLVVVLILVLCSACADSAPETSVDAATSLAADFEAPSFFAESMTERAAALLVVVDAMPLEPSGFENGVGSGVDGRDLTESFATYALTVGDDDYDQWLSEAWAMHEALVGQGFEAVHHSCNQSIVVTHTFRGLYQNDDEVLLSLEWPREDSSEGQLEVRFVGGSPERFSGYQFDPGPNPEMCLPAISAGG